MKKINKMFIIVIYNIEYLLIISFEFNAAILNMITIRYIKGKAFWSTRSTLKWHTHVAHLSKL